jgi:hypothetical protein
MAEKTSNPRLRRLVFDDGVKAEMLMKTTVAVRTNVKRRRRWT